MKKLLEGMDRFREQVYPRYAGRLRELARAQQPEALLITCADSRVLPSLFLQSDPGDLFLCRNAGNIVPPYDDHLGGVAATVEYAVDVLGIRHLIVCGHSDCGAMKGVLHPESLAGCPAVARWLGHAERARRIALQGVRSTSAEEELRRVTEENVIAQLENLATHPAVAAALARGAVDLYGWYFDIPSGAVSSYHPAQGTFVPCDGGVTAATPHLRWRRAGTAA